MAIRPKRVKKRKSRTTILMSVKPPKAEVARRRWHFRLVPTRDIGGVGIAGAMWHIAMPVEGPSTASVSDIRLPYIVGTLSSADVLSAISHRDVNLPVDQRGAND